MELNFIEPPSIGEILREEFMEPMNLSAYSIAQSIHVPVSRIQDILHDRRKITIDTSLRLAKLFVFRMNISSICRMTSIFEHKKESFISNYSKLKQYNMHNEIAKWERFVKWKNRVQLFTLFTIISIFVGRKNCAGLI